MAFDFKKEYREFYLPGGRGIVTIPPMKYLAVRGEGDPNEGRRRVQGRHRAAVRNRLPPSR